MIPSKGRFDKHLNISKPKKLTEDSVDLYVLIWAGQKTKFERKSKSFLKPGNQNQDHWFSFQILKMHLWSKINIWPGRWVILRGFWQIGRQSKALVETRVFLWVFVQYKFLSWAYFDPNKMILFWFSKNPKIILIFYGNDFWVPKWVKFWFLPSPWAFCLAFDCSTMWPSFSYRIDRDRPNLRLDFLLIFRIFGFWNIKMLIATTFENNQCEAVLGRVFTDL